jgi:hypothetical protein
VCVRERERERAREREKDRQTDREREREMGCGFGGCSDRALVDMRELVLRCHIPARRFTV